MLVSELFAVSPLLSTYFYAWYWHEPMYTAHYNNGCTRRGTQMGRIITRQKSNKLLVDPLQDNCVFFYSQFCDKRRIGWKINAWIATGKSYMLLSWCYSSKCFLTAACVAYLHIQRHSNPIRSENPYFMRAHALSLHSNGISTDLMQMRILPHISLTRDGLVPGQKFSCTVTVRKCIIGKTKSHR